MLRSLTAKYDTFMTKAEFLKYLQIPLHDTLAERVWMAHD
jgi:hypothetical protein